MKKGPAILILVGLALLAFLYFSPVTPSSPKSGTTEESGSHSESASEGLTPDQRVDEAVMKLESGELPPMQAILQIRAVADEHPENVKANFTLGLMSLQTSQYEKAIGRFEKVLEQQPQNTDAHRLLARAHLNLGDSARASESLQRAYETAVPEQKQEIDQQLKELRVN